MFIKAGIFHVSKCGKFSIREILLMNCDSSLMGKPFNNLRQRVFDNMDISSL